MASLPPLTEDEAEAQNAGMLQGGAETAPPAGSIALSDGNKTLQMIEENASYNAACTKLPTARSRADVDLLQKRTAHLRQLVKLPTEVHRELCRVMVYRKVNEGHVLARKGVPASCFQVLMSGSASVYASGEAPGTGPSEVRRVTIRSGGTESSFRANPPTEILHAGDAIGESMLQQPGPETAHSATVVANEAVELMEISSGDFGRILRADRSSEMGQMLHFLSELPCMEGQTAAELHNLSKLLTRRILPKGQLCLAHPPQAQLGPAAFSADSVYLIYRGEARLLCAPLEVDKPTGTTAALEPSQVGSLGNTTFPANRLIEASLAGELHPVATLGPTECVTQNLFAPNQKARWCLQPVTSLELLVLTRKDWNETIKPAAAAALKQQAARKAKFFAKQLASAQAASQLRRSLVLAPPTSPQASADAAGADAKPGGLRSKAGLSKADGLADSSADAAVASAGSASPTLQWRAPWDRAVEPPHAPPRGGDTPPASPQRLPSLSQPTASPPVSLRGSASTPVLGAQEQGADRPDAGQDEPHALRHILRSSWKPKQRPASTVSPQGTMPRPGSSTGGKSSDGRAGRNDLGTAAGRATKADDGGFFVHLPALVPPVWLDFFEKE